MPSRPTICITDVKVACHSSKVKVGVQVSGNAPVSLFITPIFILIYMGVFSFKLMKWIENEDLFISQLIEGYKWQCYVYYKLQKLGLDVELAPFRVRKSIDEITGFTENDVDLTVNLSDRKLNIEVKSRGDISFSDNPFSYPYEYPFLDTHEGLARKVNTLFAIFLVSAKTKSILVFPFDKQKCQFTSVYDSKRGIRNNVVTTHRRNLVSLKEWYELLKV